jgi:hypothetical protein
MDEQRTEREGGRSVNACKRTTIVIVLRLIALVTVLSLFIAWVHICAVLRQETADTHRLSAPATLPPIN